MKAAGALRNLTIESSLAKAIAAEGAIAPLVTLFRAGDDNARVALANIADTSPSARAAVVRAGGPS
jgi:hypothetical protein